MGSNSIGWVRIGHQLEDLFRRLRQYIQTENFSNEEMIEGFMKIDYLQNQKHKPRKPWWDDKVEKQVRSHYYQQMLANPSIMGQAFEAEQLAEKELYKHTVLEILPFDYMYYKQTGQINEQPSVLLAYYDQKANDTKLYSAPVEAFGLPVVS